jgi:hypothetical protein
MTTTDKTTTDKPRLKLSGQNGNAFMLLGLAHKAAKKAGWDTERWNAVKREAMGGDYDHLLATLMEHFDVG